MKILVAPDSFKDALAAVEVCAAIKKGILEASPTAAVVLCPMADGGEGTVDILHHHLSGQKQKVLVHDPLMRPVKACYFLLGETAYVEMAQASGLQLLNQGERNPMLTTSFGTGELIRHALSKGSKKVYLAVGGSATNDGGMGMAAALGWKFLGENGAQITPIGGNLGKITQVLPPHNPAEEMTTTRFFLLSDVANPLCGPNGAAYVYAKQKGASPSEVAALDAGLRHFAKIVKTGLGKDCAEMEGAGAAGGLGFGAMAFLDAEQQSGAEALMELVDFKEKLAWADLVITGEGKLDGQTAQGKLIGKICQKAREMGVPVFAICGKIEATKEQLQAIGLKNAMQLQRLSETVSEAIKRTPEALKMAANALITQFLSHSTSSLNQVDLDI